MTIAQLQSIHYVPTDSIQSTAAAAATPDAAAYTKNTNTTTAAIAGESQSLFMRLSSIQPLWLVVIGCGIFALIASIGLLLDSSPSSIVQLPSTDSHSNPSGIKYFTSELDTKLGYWSPITSTIDWCESNYSNSSYIAEYWNSISSLSMCIFAIIGIIHGYSHSIEKRFYIYNLMLFTVGLGSFIFHSTLTLVGQFLDELPMIYCSCSWFYILILNNQSKYYREYIPTSSSPIAVNYHQSHYNNKFDYQSLSSNNNTNNSNNSNSLVPGLYPNHSRDYWLYFFIFYAIFWTIIHSFQSFVAIFQIHFIAIIFCGILKLSLIYSNNSNLYRIPAIQKLIIYYIGLLLLAVSCWLIDQHYCIPFNNNTTSIPNLQYHSLWHLFIGLDCYYGLIIGESLRIINLAYQAYLRQLYWNQLELGLIDSSSSSITATTEQFQPENHLQLRYWCYLIPYIEYDSIEKRIK